MSTTMANKKSMSWWIHIIITIGLMVVIGMLSPFGAITPLGMKVLGIFVGMMWGWIFCGLAMPSILGLVALVVVGYDTGTNVFGAMFSSTVIQVIFCFMVAGLFNAFGVTHYIAGKLMSVKFIVGHPWKLAAMIFVCAGLLSAVVDVVPAIFLMWAIFEKAAEDVDCKQEEHFYSFVIAGIVISACVFGAVLPFKPTAVVYMGFAAGLVSIDMIPLLPYLCYMMVYSVLVMAGYLAFGKFIMKLDVSKFETDLDIFESMRNKKASKQEKIGLILIGAFVGLLLWPSIFPAEWALTKVFKSLGLVGVCAALIAIGFFLKDDNGNPIVTSKIITAGIGWDIIFLLGATFPTAAAMRSADCGIMATINAFVKPLAMDLGPAALVVITVVLLGVLTQIAHNGVLAAMFMPFLIPLYVEMGGYTIVYWMLIYMALQASFATPAASMYSGMIFGHDSCEGTKLAYVYGIVVMAISLVLLVASFPLLNMIIAC